MATTRGQRVIYVCISTLKVLALSGGSLSIEKYEELQFSVKVYQWCSSLINIFNFLSMDENVLN